MKELIARLRAKDLVTSIIKSCFVVPGRHPAEINKLCNEAADAIEKLIEQAEKNK
jgi:predicted urease superfamily metal-dependent hydrolase